MFASLLLIHQRADQHDETADVLAKLRAAMADPRFQEYLSDSPPERATLTIIPAGE